MAWLRPSCSRNPSMEPIATTGRPAEGTGPLMRATALHIQLTELSETCIDLTFCASLTEHLPRLLPGPVRRKLQRGAIDLASIARSARAQDYAPGELFCFAEGPRVLRAWLE